MANYELCEPFDIDDGSLGGMKPEFIFCLGVEWQLFRQQMQSEPGPFDYQAHSANADRLIAMCQRHGRSCTRHWLHEDYPEWCVLKVGGES